MDTQRGIYARLDALHIPYRALEHEPVYSISDCHRVVEGALSAVMPKNLFLTPRNQSARYLCVIRPDAAFVTSEISRQIGCSRLSFGSADWMMRTLRTTPGAVSPMGLLFEESREVELVIDRELLHIPVLAFHPNVNTASLAMTSEVFFTRFLPALGREPKWISP